MNRANVKRLWDFIVEYWDLLIFLVGSLAVGLLSLLGIIPEIKTVVSTILVALSVLAYSMVQTRVKFNKAVEKINHLDMFENQEKLYEEVRAHIHQHGAKNAVLIHYSGHMVRDTVRDLMSKGADVILYVQSKTTAKKFSKTQVMRIESFSELFKTEIDSAIKGGLRNRGTLTVYEYDAPASLRAIKIDDKLIGVGWYIYRYVDREDPEENQKYPEDNIKLLGHDQPGKILFSGSHEYAVMNKLIENLAENFTRQNKRENKQPIFRI